MVSRPPATAALRRVGIGLVAGAVLLLPLAGVVPAELAALVVVALGLGAYAIERSRDAIVGVSVGLVAAGLFLAVDRQLDPVGATVARSASATVAIGVGVIVATYVVDAGALRANGG